VIHYCIDVLTVDGFVDRMNNFIIKTPDEELHGAVIELLKEDFRLRERMNVCRGASPDAETPDGGQYYNTWLQQGVSLVAIDPKDGHIIGAAVNQIVDKSSHGFEVSPTMPLRQRFFFTVIGELEGGIDVFEELQTDKGMELTILSVRKEYSGQGLGRKLAEKTIEQARKLELKFIQSVPTAPQTIHLFEALGFETRKERKFGDMSFEGSPAFPLATAADRARYVVKKL